MLKSPAHANLKENKDMKKYKKKSELTERTNMGFKTLSDELNIDDVNDQLAKVPGLGFELHLGSRKPQPMRGGGHGMLRIEDINESVSRITNGMDGLFEKKN